MESYNEIEEAKKSTHAEKDDESDEPSFSSARTHARAWKHAHRWRREFFLTAVQRIQILNEQLYPSSPRSISFLPRESLIKLKTFPKVQLLYTNCSHKSTHRLSKMVSPMNELRLKYFFFTGGEQSRILNALLTHEVSAFSFFSF